MLTELTALSIFSEILISLCSLWSFKSVDISVERKREDVTMEMIQLVCEFNTLVLMFEFSWNNIFLFAVQATKSLSSAFTSIHQHVKPRDWIKTYACVSAWVQLRLLTCEFAALTLFLDSRPLVIFLPIVFVRPVNQNNQPVRNLLIVVKCHKQQQRELID